MLDLPKIIEAYVGRFPAEASRVARFADYVRQVPAPNVFTRKNFIGHITGSAFILDLTRTKLLLIHHQFLDRWLQPGGHIDEGERPIEAALREAAEEVGLSSADLEPVDPPTIASDVPFDLDSHFIPPNAKKIEDSHYHHDFRYLFRFIGKTSPIANSDETHGLRWVSLDELDSHEEFGRIANKIRECIGK